jgi:general stress protein 13
VAEKYKIGEIVSGKVLKINPFGLFVELDQDIHGLAHITELSEKPITDLNEIAKINDVIKFKIITIEPKNHRLGLSLKTSKEGPTAKAATEKKPKTEKTADIKETKVEENKVEEEKPAKKPAKAKEEKEKKAKSAKKAKK